METTVEGLGFRVENARLAFLILTPELKTLNPTPAQS